MMSNVTVVIPPFPSQDLAKLVLGYLAEEQLMTAYDEFLQASPYLDALQNEYDRIFMTSLKNILAEYRAVKIYVETCKPFALRRKLFQCTNLLEIVKFLVNNIDLNKLHSLDGTLEKVGFSRHSLSKSYSCDVCHSLKLSNCTCKSNQSTSQIEANSFEGSVETTSLADLPGNISYKKKIVKEAEPKCYTSTSITSSDQITDGRSAKFSENLSSTTFGSDTTDNVISSVTEKKSSPNPSFLVTEHLTESKQNVQGANDILNLVSHNRNDIGCNQQALKDTETTPQIEVTDTLHNVAAGDSSNIKVTVPDSSTSENIVIQTSTAEVDNVTNSINVSKGNVRPPPLLIKIGNDHKHMSLQPNTLHTLPRLASKSLLGKCASKKVEEQISPKITILSDVKVDNDVIMPPILKSNASTSLVPIQTLYINGTQAYKNQQQVEQRFTKDEIMAMPTIILVPATDTTKKIVPTVTQNNLLNTAVSCSTAQSLEPLVIDVSSNDDIDTSSQMNNTNYPVNPEKQTNDNMLIKTVDVMTVSHASLPKDNTLAGLKTSTPHVLPPARKSSSTPRRTSHVRVLDFTTPRRILNEVLNEQEANHCPPTDVPLAQDSSLPVIDKNCEDTVNIVNNISNPDKSNDIHSGPTKEKKSIKLYNWDSELRALAYVGNGNIETTEPRRKTKPKKSKRKESPTDKSTTTPASKKHNKSVDAKINDIKKVTPNIKSTKCRKKSIEADTNDNEKQESITSIVKPTINIISGKKWTEPVETEKSQNKSSNVDAMDTPELEKISLEKEIGVKLNISDLLETPYKQALYDIQMETPKFLGPDILGDPLSDIKIMSIPTPRFLNTPKIPQNTPSSYSSRPTDYSSGGSYYKPDDQDYVLGNEILADVPPLSTASSKLNNESKSTDLKNGNFEKGCKGKSRPVRQCTKNVSYNYSKVKDVEEKIEKSSTCSESSINKSDRKIHNPKMTKSNKDSVVGKETETKKKIKKYKSPMKKEVPKMFMKIKPRRTTPVKEVLGKGRKKTSDLSQVVYIKQESASISPVVVPVLTKSRRKSSTPRKLHCTKRFNSKGAGINSPEGKKQNLESSQITSINAICIQESDNEQPPLQWSDDGSQESKVKTTEEKLHANESDDINRIREYISNTVPNETAGCNECEGTLQVDLVKRGFDIETARMIERDLLEISCSNLPQQDIPVQTILQSMPSPISHEKENESKSKTFDQSTESDCSTSNNLQIVQDEDDNDEVDFSVQECNEDTSNYFVYNYDEANFIPTNQVKLKEKFSMEICIENDVTIRLRAMPFNIGFEHDSKHEHPDTCDKSSREKPASPSYDNLYTPRKAQCYQLFDSTLASLDTPLKSNSPKAKEFETVAEIVLEVEKLETDIKLKPETKKRKRIQSGTSDETSNGSKKVKPDTSYLLNSAGIQNIDIESVLSKLHGP